MLPQLQWAGWDRQGQLLAATRSGHLQVWEIRRGEPKVVFDEDLTVLEPDCRPAPSWASRWRRCDDDARRAITACSHNGVRRLQHRRGQMKALLEQPRGGDRRSIGAVPQVVRQVLAEPCPFSVVFDGITDADPLIRMRCADTAETITVARPDLLAPYARRVIALAKTATQKQLRWHLAQMLSRVALGKAQRQRAVGVMDVYLADTSRIVQVCAMQLLADIAAKDGELCAPIVAQLERLTRSGSPAVKSGGKRLLALLGRTAKAASPRR